MVGLLLLIIYLSFISLGLPVSILGSAWPFMHMQLGVPSFYAGGIAIIISAGTIVSSLNSDRLTKRLGTGKVTFLSVAMTAVALFGFSVSSSYWLLCLWAIPYGLVAGSVDAALNNYVALNFKSRHMSWLHCMWGVGATIGPYIMGSVLAHGSSWNTGYRAISMIQITLSAILFLSLPLWKNGAATQKRNDSGKVISKSLSLAEVIKLPGAKAIMLCFFCYCAIEQTTGLWVSSYLTAGKGVPPETAAGLAGMFFLGITIGRAFSGFMTFRFNDSHMIKMGISLITLGLIALFLPGNVLISYIGLIIIGLGCAPVYPSIIHSVPTHFGAEYSQPVIGVLMASAYTGTLLMPPLFGLIARYLGVNILPIYLALILALMAFMYRKLLVQTR